MYLPSFLLSVPLAGALRFGLGLFIHMCLPGSYRSPAGALYNAKHEGPYYTTDSTGDY